MCGVALSLRGERNITQVASPLAMCYIVCDLKIHAILYELFLRYFKFLTMTGGNRKVPLNLYDIIIISKKVSGRRYRVSSKSFMSRDIFICLFIYNKV